MTNFAVNISINLKKTSTMKKKTLTLISAFMALSMGYAQNTDGIIAQPTHVVGMRINASGEVTATLESNFTYYENGKPRTFAIPDYALSTTYKYEGDYFIRESSSRTDYCLLFLSKTNGVYITIIERQQRLRRFPSEIP